MKKQLFLGLLLSAVFAGCSKSDDFEQVLESEVLDSGLESVVAQSGSRGSAAFSYESWLQVNLVTRASGEQKITATCNARISALVREQKVESFDLKPLKLSYTGQEKNRNRQGNYVSVIDSAMVWRFDYGAFAYDYELEYQVPVYDDGVTKQIMPYHRFEHVSYSPNYTLTDMETAVIRGVTYERKLFQQRVSAEFAGKVYVVENTLILMKKIGGKEVVSDDPYHVWTEIVDDGYERNGGEYRTWMKVVQHWSDGSKREVECSAILRAEGRANTLPYKVVPNADVELLSWRLEKGQRDSGGGSDVTSNICVYNQHYRCILEYNLFTAETEFVVEGAYYVDDVVAYPMPVPELHGVTVPAPTIHFIGPDSSEKEGDFISYYYEQNITAWLGSGILEAYVGCQLVVK